MLFYDLRFFVCCWVARIGHCTNWASNYNGKAVSGTLMIAERNYLEPLENPTGASVASVLNTAEVRKWVVSVRKKKKPSKIVCLVLVSLENVRIL